MYTLFYIIDGHHTCVCCAVDYVGSPSSSIGASSVPGGEDFQLPSYDDLVGGSHDDEEEEHVMDENERIALQEAEDERMARQLAHGVDGAEVVCVCGGGGGGRDSHVII